MVLTLHWAQGSPGVLCENSDYSALTPETLLDLGICISLGKKNSESFSFLNNFIYLFLAVLGLLCCVGFSLVDVPGLLIAVASLVGASLGAQMVKSLPAMQETQV